MVKLQFRYLNIASKFAGCNSGIEYVKNPDKIKIDYK